MKSATLHRTFLWLSGMLCAVSFALTPVALAQVSEAQFNAAQQKQTDLTKEIQTVTAKMSEAQTSGNLDTYNALKADYERLAKEISAQKKIIQDFMSANKELTAVQKLYNDANEKYRLNQVSVAEQLYNQCIAEAKKVNSPALNDAVSKSYYGLGRIYAINKKENGKALEYYKQALQFDSQNDKIYLGMGNAQDRLGDQNGAIASFLKATQLNPTNTSAYLNLGVSYYQSKKMEEAEATFIKITEMERNNAKAWYYLGRILSEARRFQEAQGALEQATKLDPKEENAWMFLAQCYNAMGDYQGAIKAAESGLQASRGHGGCYLEIGKAYKKLNNEAKAIENFNLGARDRQYRDMNNYEIQMLEFEKQGQ